MVTFGGYTVLGVKRAHVYVGATGDRTGHAVVLLKLAHLRTWQARRLPRAGLLPPNPVPRFPRGTSKSCASSSGARAAPALERARPRTYVQGAQLVGLRARLFPALMRTSGRTCGPAVLRTSVEEAAPTSASAIRAVLMAIMLRSVCLYVGGETLLTDDCRPTADRLSAASRSPAAWDRAPRA